MLDLEGERKVDRPLWIFYRKISAANFALSRNSWKIGSLIFPRSEVLSWSAFERSFVIGRIVDEIGLQVGTCSSVAGDS